MSNLTVRASSWGSLFDCAMKWEGEHILGIRKAAGLRALLGTSVHAGTAAFDSAHLAHADIRPDDAAGVFVDTLRNPEFEVDYQQDDLTSNEAERIGLTLTTKYCTDIAPQFKYLAVEMKLAPMEIDCGGDVTITLTGTMDRARAAETESGDIIPDVKTGSRVVSQGIATMKGRLAQTGTYEIMYGNTTGRPTAGGQIIGLGTSSKTPVAISPVFDGRRVMLGTSEQPGLIEYAAKMFRAGLFPPNPQSPLCSPKYCARWSTCIFHE